MTQNNQTVLVRFDGRYFSYADTNGDLVKIPAISGRPDRQDVNLQNQIGSGLLPEGMYNIRGDGIGGFNLWKIFRLVFLIICQIGKLGSFSIGAS